jgi:hypothetical protein
MRDGEVISFDWYRELLEECRQILAGVISQGSELLVRGKYELGRRIYEEFLKDRERWELYGGEVVRNLAADLGIHWQRLYECIAVARRYQSVEDLFRQCRNIFGRVSWRLIVRHLLPKEPSRGLILEGAWWQFIKDCERIMGRLEAVFEYREVPEELKEQVEGLFHHLKQSLDDFELRFLLV